MKSAVSYLHETMKRDFIIFMENTLRFISLLRCTEWLSNRSCSVLAPLDISNHTKRFIFITFFPSIPLLRWQARLGKRKAEIVKILCVYAGWFYGESEMEIDEKRGYFLVRILADSFLFVFTLKRYKMG